MKKKFALAICFFIFCTAIAQTKPREKKYPSLLWEITGKGLKKPSFLIGTMHVSSKIAFNLPDSFYHAVRNAQMVALETNPETWQEDMSKYNLDEGYGYSTKYGNGDYTIAPSDYLNINSLKFYKYHTKIERSLYSSPSTINNLLYRSYGNGSSDFEEDTYLDMYIFQCGKKWGKQVAGVENYAESMRLMSEAYKDAANEKNRKERSYSDNDDEFSQDKLQEAYRTGNLDLLDSINKYNSFSEAFDEKFLYKRNEIQANSIDSIVKSGTILFVGVGAAHLPGDRGVIEMLREKGYQLRPVKMGERASKAKELVDKIRVPVAFKTETAEDGFFKVDIPGKFYKFGEDGSINQQQYADMANGSYYMVTRVMTNAWMWNHNADDVYRTIDSLLYENVPGKIISKLPISKNGYKGLDITNQTRRGDIQRYNIFITPFEIIFFKMSGNAGYVQSGDEAKKFFGSIQLKEYKNVPFPVAGEWRKYSPSYGGFAVNMPHEPFIGNDGSWIFDASDNKTGINYRVIRTDIHNYGFAEEDTFDLGLLEESFMSSEFIDTQLSRQQITFKGYPALESSFKDKNGKLYKVRFIIQGPHYYTLLTHGKQELPAMNDFLNSFEIKPFVYGEVKTKKDTSLYYTVTTPYFPEEKKIKLDIPRYNYYGEVEDEDKESESDLLEAGAFRNKIISNDTTGEKIYISFYRSPRYYFAKDSSSLDKDNEASLTHDSTWIVKSRKKTELPNKTKVWELVLTDTGSSRALWYKTFYKDGIGFSLLSQIDTLSKPSTFIKSFYDTFTPVDTLKGVNPFTKKSALFFQDFMSSDSALRKLAVKNISTIELDSTDLPQLIQIINQLNWNEKKYLDIKKSLIDKLDAIKTNASAAYLKSLYYAVGDTIQLQYAVLENLLQQKTSIAYQVFKDIINTEPPVLSFSDVSYSDYSYINRNFSYSATYKYDDGKFLDELSDSLILTRTILADLLPLLNLEDYKSNIMKLLGQMVDSSLVTSREYDLYFNKFMLEAKHELKKQAIAEKNISIAKAEDNKTGKKTTSYYKTDNDEDSGNDDLTLYATLLLPYWDSNPAVKLLVQQMLTSNDKRLKYNTLMLLIDKGKSYTDTLLKYFAALDEYRYELYSNLKERKMMEKFPSLYNNHLDLGTSALFDKQSFNKPDTVVYIDRLKAEYKDKKGYIYFFKYKQKKDDLTWKLATVGLTPENPASFEFEDATRKGDKYEPVSWTVYNKYSFTALSTTKVKEEESMSLFLKKQLKKMLYSRRNSAKEFYTDEGENNNEPVYLD